MTDAYRPDDEDELSWAVRQNRLNQEQRTARTYTDPLAPSPEGASSIRRLSEESGLPEADVQLDQGAAQRAAEARRAGGILANSPRLREWIGDPRNAAVARDDVENLSIFERIWRDTLLASAGRAPSAEGQQQADVAAALGGPATLFPYLAARTATSRGDFSGREQYRQGELDVEQGRLAYGRYRAHRDGVEFPAESLSRLDELTNREGADDWGAPFIGPTARLLPQMLGSLERAGRQTDARLQDHDRTVYGERAVRPREADDGESYGIPVERPDRGLRGVAEGAGAATAYGMGFLPAAIGGAGGGYLSFGNEMETGLAFDEMLRAGADPDIAAQRAEEYGAWATGIEFFSDATGLRLSGAGKLAARALLRDRVLQVARPGARAAAAVGATSAEQGLEEASQQLAQIIHNDLAQQETRTGDSDVGAAWREAMTPEAIEQILKAGYVGAQGGAGMAAIPATANLGLDIRANQRAEQNAARFEEWTRAAQASKLGARLPSAFESAVAAVDDSNVFIDADRFIEHFQGAGVNPYSVAEELGVSAEQLAQAVSSHAQVQIPTSTFAARVLRDPKHAALAEHTRISPTDATPAEAKMAGEVFRAEIERIAQETETAQSDDEIGQVVETRVRELFDAAAKEGGPRPEVARQYAKLAAALPRALMARARASGDEAYASRLETSLRNLYGKNLDIAGPGREVGAAGAGVAEAEQRGGRSGAPTQNTQWTPPAGVRLTEQQRKIAEMAINGAGNEWIAEEMEVGAKHVVNVLAKVANRLGNRPWEKGRLTGRTTEVSIERLVKLRHELLASGYTMRRGQKEGIYEIIARRTGLTANNVKQRLFQYDKAQKALAEAERAQPAPTKREAKPFDLRSEEGRREWFEENVLVAPIPGEAPDARNYGFALDNGEIIVASIAPDPTGAASAEWDFLDQKRDPDEDSRFKQKKNRLGVRGALQLAARLTAIVEADIAEFSRDAYVYTPYTPSIEKLNAALIDKLVKYTPYTLRDDGAGTYYMVRDGADIASTGQVLPSPEHANDPQIDWPQVDPAEVTALEGRYFDRLEHFAATGDRGSDGQADDLGGEPQPGGGVAGPRGPGSGELDQRRVTDGIGPDGLPIRPREPFRNSLRGGNDDLAGAARGDFGDEKADETVDPDAPEEAQQGEAKGSIRYQNFKAGEFGEAMIRMGKSADLSTFLHEFGHLGHLVLESIATDPQAPEEFKSMWSNTLQWWGVSQEQWDSFDTEQKRDYFEVWARSFEAYLMEGKAPSLGLREAFAAFKAWFQRIYNQIFRLDHKLNPAIRDVFDRLLATDQEIAEARAAMGSDFNLQREWFPAMKDEEWAALQASAAEAREAAEGELRARVMDARVRKDKRWWRAERSRVRPTAEIEVDTDPARRAYEWLAFGEWRALPTETNDEGQVVPVDAQTEMPEGLPAMRLDTAALDEEDRAGLPEALRPLASEEDVSAALDNAMALKRQGRARQPQRLWAFIKARGGIKDTGGEIRQALGSARARPGLINNETGLDPDDLALAAWEAGYFGAVPRKGPGITLEQPTEGDDASPSRASSGGREHRFATSTEEGGRRHLQIDGGDGFISYWPEDGAWRVNASYVEPTLQGQGRGVALYERLIADAREAGVPVIRSDDEVSVPARNVYAALRRRGYGVTERNGRFEIATNAPDGGGAGARQNLFGERVERLPFTQHAAEGGLQEFRFPMADGSHGRIAGIRTGDTFQIKNSGIPPEFQGRGLGTRMYATLLENLRENGVRRVLSDTEMTGDSVRVYDRLSGMGYRVFENEAPRSYTRNAHQSLFRSQNGEALWGVDLSDGPTASTSDEGGSFEAFQDGELFAGDKRPTPQELLDALIDDIKNVRQVYSSKDEAAVEAYQNRADAIRWFESRGIDLDGSKEEIRAQIVEALGREQEETGGGYHPDDIAPWFGFESGDAMVQAMKGLKPRAVAIEENIEKRLNDEYGDPLRDGTTAEAARLAAHVEAQARRIELELEAIQRATGRKRTPVGRAAKAYAERQVANMTVKQVRNFDAYLAGERRAARASMEAAAKGDMQTAGLMKQRQLISFHLYRLARDAAEEMDRAQRYFQKFDRDTIRAKIHAPLLDQIDQALEGIDLRQRPRISDRRRQAFSQWFAEMQAEGLTHQVAIDPDFMEEVRQKPFAALTLEEARAMRDAIRNFEHIGKRWREVLADRDNRLLDEQVAEMTASMAEVKPLELANMDTHSPGAVESLDLGRQALHGQLSRVEPVARAMDRQKENGPVWNGLFRPLTEARDREETRQEQAQRDIERLFSVYTAGERSDMWVKRKHYPQVPNRNGSRMGRSFTKQEILAIALNSGNEYNWNALIAGDNWTEDQVRALLNAAMTKRDWDFVQSAWDYVDSFWPEITALYEKTTGVVPPKVEARPFQTRFGEYAGGYWHLDYDWGRDQRVKEELEHGAIQDAFGGFRLRTQTPNGFSRARQGSGGRPVRLDLSILSEHVNEVIHDLEFRVPVLDVWRIIKHPEFRRAFVQSAGQAQYDQLKPWLQFVATERMPPERGYSAILKLFRRNTPIVLMGYAASTIAQQPAGIMGTFHRVGTGRVMGKVLDLASKPWTWVAHARFINARSAFMRKYATISQRELREMVNEINSKGHVDAVNLLVRGSPQQKLQALGRISQLMQRYAMFPLAFVNKWVASAAWKAAYDRALAGKVEGVDENNEKDVIAYADTVIRNTFGSGRPEDLPPIMRSTEIGKLITPAFSYFSTQYNQLYNEQVPGMLRGQISPLEFATFITWTIVIQTLASQWLAGRWEPDDDETEEERDLRLGLEVAQASIAGVPLARDMTRAMLNRAATGERTFGTSVPALGALTSTGGGVGGAVHDLSTEGEISRATARDLTMAAGYWFGLPSRQMWTTGSYISDVAEGEEALPWDAEDPVDATSEMLLRDTR